MSANLAVSKLVLGLSAAMLVLLAAFPLNARASYYLVYAPVACDYCERPYYRPVRKVHKPCRHQHHKHVKHDRRSGYSITVYYPVPVYPRTCSACCGGFIAPAYYYAPVPERVYFSKSTDRLVGNRYENSFSDPSLDTDTADGDNY